MKADATTTGVALIAMLQIGTTLFGACVAHFATGGHGLHPPMHQPFIIWFMRGFGALVLMGLTVAWAARTLWLRGNSQADDQTRISAQVAGVVFLGLLVWMDMALLCMI